MSVISRVASWDRKFAWSFFGFLLAVFFGGLTLYNEFIKNPNPALTVQILSDTNVLDVRENIPELKIIYGDVDIKNLNQTLSVLVFRVQNLGGAAILNSYYDEKAVPSVILNAGKFVKVEQLAATNDYLKGSAHPLLAGQSSLQLPRVILEPGESYTIKALLLHGPRNGPLLQVVGKVAGVREISVLMPEVDEKAESFWSSVLSGSVLTQLVRAPIYFFGFILVLVVIIAPVAFISDRLEKFFRRRLVKQFTKHHEGEIGSSENLVLDAYREYGVAPLVRIKELLGDEKKLLKSLQHAEKRKADSSGRPLGVRGAGPENMFETHPSRRALIYAHGGIPLDLLDKLQIAAISPGGACEVNRPLEQFLIRFIDYVNIKKS